MVESVGRPLLILLAIRLVGSGATAMILGTAAAVTAALIPFGIGRTRDTKENKEAVESNVLNASLLADMHKFARPFVPVFLIIWITSLSDRYIIAWFTHDSSSVGRYAAVYALISQPFIMSHTVISLTLRPIYFAATSQNNVVHARHTLRLWFVVSLIVCGIGVVLATLARNQVVAIFLAAQYRQTAPLVPWIATGYLFYVLQQVLEQALIAQKRSIAVLVGQTCGAVSSFVATIPLVHYRGIMGAAYACPIYFSVAAAATAWMIMQGGPKIHAGVGGHVGSKLLT